MVKCETAITIEETDGIDTRSKSPKPELIVKSHWTLRDKIVLVLDGKTHVVDLAELRIAVRNAGGLSLRH